MKRTNVLVLFAAAVLVTAAVAPAGAAPPVKIGVAYDAAGLGDGGFNDLAQAGALQAAADLGVKLFEKEPFKKNGTPLDAQDVIDKLAKRSDLVVAVGFTYMESVESAAASSPDTNFAVIDLGFAAPPDNLLGASAAQNEGSFLVGAAAALESDSGQIGFVGGIAFPVIQEFEAGFVAGVTHVDATTTVEVAYADTFTDTSIMYGIATSMYTSGIDVIYHAAGFAGLGLFEAARDYTIATGDHVWAIGVDFDQYQQVPDDLKPHILTSMKKNVDTIAYDVIKSQVDGTFGGGNDRWDLSRNGVDYATSGGFVDLHVPTLEALKQDIIDGTIVVPTVP